MKWLTQCAQRFCDILKKEKPPLDAMEGVPDHPLSKTKEIIGEFLVMLK